MHKNDILQGLITYFDLLYEPKKWWLEFVSDQAFKLGIEEGFKELEKFDEVLAAEFLEAGEAFLVANMNGLVDEAADFGAQLFKILVFKIK